MVLHRDKQNPGTLPAQRGSRRSRIGYNCSPFCFAIVLFGGCTNAELDFNLPDSMAMVDAGTDRDGSSQIKNDGATSVIARDAGTSDGNPVDDSPDASVANTEDASLPDGSTATPPARQWTDVTGNLAGLSSSCTAPTIVAAHPARAVVIAGVDGQGLWSVDNDGTSWRRLGQGQDSADIENRPANIVFDPDDPMVFWEVGPYAAGVFRTDDGGETFTRLGDLQNTLSVAVDFTDPLRKTLLGTTRNRRSELYLSEDGGQSWKNIGPSSPNAASNCHSVEVVDATNFVLGCGSIYRSADKGASWTKVYDGDVGTQSVLARSNRDIYWPKRISGGLVVSTDGGRQFKESSGSEQAAQAYIGTHLTELPDGRIVSVGQDSLYASADRGDTWQKVGETLPFDAQGVTYSPALKAFYIWKIGGCGNGSEPIGNTSVMRSGFDWQTE